MTLLQIYYISLLWVISESLDYITTLILAQILVSICQDTHLVRTSYVPHRMWPPWRHTVRLSALAPLQVQQMFLGRTDEKLLNFDTKSVLNACKCILAWTKCTQMLHHVGELGDWLPAWWARKKCLSVSLSQAPSFLANPEPTTLSLRHATGFLTILHDYKAYKLLKASKSMKSEKRKAFEKNHQSFGFPVSFLGCTPLRDLKV